MALVRYRPNINGKIVSNDRKRFQMESLILMTSHKERDNAEKCTNSSISLFAAYYPL